MSKCEVCKNFINLRNSVFNEIFQSEYDNKTKLWLYYNNPEVTDEKFEKGFELCKSCYDETCKQFKNCDPEIKKFTEEKGTNELKLRKNKKLNSINSNANCKTCDQYGKWIETYQSNPLTEKQLEQWVETCNKCWDLCEENKIRDPYCRRAKSLADVGEQRKDKRRLENLEKKYKVEKFQRDFKKK